MKSLRRFFHPNCLVALTHVTYHRSPILVENVALWNDAVDLALKRYSFVVVAWVVLPDHLHLLLDSRESNVSQVMKIVKMSFAEKYRNIHGISGPIWQHRFWDHVIRDAEDFKAQLHYIHYNPVKHGIVRVVREYRHSSFHQYVENGYYDIDWGLDFNADENHVYGE